MKTKLLLSVLLLSLTIHLHGQTTSFSYGEFDYTIAKDNSYVTLTALDGTLKGDIVIPDSVTFEENKYAVKYIGSFGNNPDVTSVYIPKTITYIDSYSISSLTGLQNIYVDKGHPRYQSIDGMLVFSSDMSLTVYPFGRKGDYAIPEGIKRISTEFCPGINKLSIPSTVTTVDNYINRYVKFFEVSPENVQFSSMNGVLFSKDGKTLIAYPQTDETIVSLPSTIDSIGSYAFYYNRKKLILNSATPPAIGNYSSYYTTNHDIEGIYVRNEYLPVYQTDKRTASYDLFGYDLDVDSILYSVNTDGKAELTGCYRLSEKVVIPETISDDKSQTYTVSSIGRISFYENYNLHEVNLPETLESIGDSAFCFTHISTIKLPASLKSIGKNAFYNYNFNYRSNLFAECAPVDISAGCFYDYGTLYVPSEYYEQYKTAAGWKNFTIIAGDYNIDGFVYKKLTDETVSLVKYTGSAKEIIIPDIITIKGKQYRVTDIGERAFYDKGISKLTLPTTLESIGEYAFNYNKIAELDIPQSVRRIGSYAFSSNNIGSVTLKDRDVFEIGYYALGYTGNIRIYVIPAANVDNFKIADGWKDYEYIYGVDAVVDDTGYKILNETDVALVGSGKRYDTQDASIRHFDIPETVAIGETNYRVTTIADSAFYQTNANYFTIPASVDSIGVRAIYSFYTMEMKGATPAHINKESFSQWSTKTILVPPMALNDYKEADVWSTFASYIKPNGANVDGIIYTPIDDNRAGVTYAASLPANRILFIPPEVDIDGKNYKVAVIGGGAFYQNKPDFLVLPETIDSISDPNDLAYDFTYLKAMAPPKIAGWHSNRKFFVPSAAKASYDADSKWRYERDGEDYIIGVDGMIDSLVYKTTGSETATICAWMKTINSGDTIRVPSSITLDNSMQLTVTGVGDQLFGEWVNYLFLPSSITTIGKDVLRRVSYSIYCDALIPPAIADENNNNQNATLWVKGSAVQAYLDDEVWSRFKIRSEDADAPLFKLKALFDEHAEITGVLADNLITIAIPDSVMMNGRQMAITSIGDRAFSDQRQLQSLVVSSTVEHFGSNVFYRDTYTNLEKIQIRAGSQHLVSRNNLLLTKDGKTLIKAGRRGVEATYYDTGKVENTLDGVETLVPGALDGCETWVGHSEGNRTTYSAGIVLPASLKVIMAEDLMYIYYLQNIIVDTLSQTLCDVDGVLFSKDTTSVIYYPNNRSDNSYELPSKVKRIEKFSFYRAELNSLTLSDSLKFIADSAFYLSDYYNPIRELVLLNEELAEVTELSFTNRMYSNTTLYVPMGTQYDYLNTYPWSKFRNINSAVLAEEDYLLVKAFYQEMGNGEGWYNKWTIGETAAQTRIRGTRMKDTHIYSLDLSQNGLRGPLSDKLFRLHGLEILNLSNNNLTGRIDSVLNKEYISNNALRELNIANNKLSGNIGAVGETLNNLTTLNANNNCLTQVSPILPSTITSVDVGGQKMGVYDYETILQACTPSVESGSPNLLYYRSGSRSFDSNASFTIYEPEKYSWYMYLNRNDGDSYFSKYSDKYSVYKLPNSITLKLAGGEGTHSATVLLAFEDGDVNFDSEVDVSDLQSTVNYALSEETSQLFNYTAADLQADDWINVQDVVSLANIIISQDVEEETSGTSASRSVKTNEDAPVAELTWQGNKLVLRSSQDVAAIDIVLTNAEHVIWLVNDYDYDIMVREKQGKTHILHYSVNGKTIKAGETILAEASGEGVRICRAILVDKKAQRISVVTNGASEATAITNLNNDVPVTVYVKDKRLYVNSKERMEDIHWSVYSMNGTLLGEGSSFSQLPGSNPLGVSLEGMQQIIVRIRSNNLNVTKKIIVNN